MYEIARRHLGKVVAGAAMAVTGTAVAVAISLPGLAGADDTPGGRGTVGVGAAGTAGSAGASGSSGEQGTDGTQGDAQAPGTAPA